MHIAGCLSQLSVNCVIHVSLNAFTHLHQSCALATVSTVPFILYIKYVIIRMIDDGNYIHVHELPVCHKCRLVRHFWPKCSGILLHEVYMYFLCLLTSACSATAPACCASIAEYDGANISVQVAYHTECWLHFYIAKIDACH